MNRKTTAVQRPRSRIAARGVALVGLAAIFCLATANPVRGDHRHHAHHHYHRHWARQPYVVSDVYYAPPPIVYPPPPAPGINLVFPIHIH